MLDQKIKSLKAEKAELDEEIDAREKILRDMFNELIKQSQLNTGLYHKIKDRVQKIQILNEQRKNVELKIYYWSARIKDYHRKITSKIESAAKTSEVKILVNRLLAESNAEQKKLIDETKAVAGLGSSSADVGTNVHKELIEQNTWLIKKLNMIDLAANNIRKIREEKIETGMNKNKKLIEECNKLKVDNDYLDRRFNHYQKFIGDFKRKKEELVRERNRQKKTQAHSDLANPSGLLPKLLRQPDQDPQPAPEPRQALGGAKQGLRSSSQSFGLKKGPKK